MRDKNIYEWVKEEETRFSHDIEVMENWFWNMKEHIRTSIMFKHGKFIKSTNDLDTKQPNKNIVYPLLNLRYRAEDIDMKDVVVYVDDPEKYHLSFLVKKYHDDVYVRENDLDTFFDEVKEEKIDLGGSLVRKGQNGPVYEPLDSIAFCDQTDILSGPIAFKTFYSPEELYATESQGWGDEKNGATVSIDELVSLAEYSKQHDENKQKTQTPGKYIEIYRVHGSFPKEWLSDGDSKKVSDKEKFVRQLHIIAFYKNEDGQNQGVCLYRKREYESPFKLHLSGKRIKNRALAYGGVEELFDPQIWTNLSEIRKKEMLEAASKVVLFTSDDAYSERNQIKDMENLEITVVREGTTIQQVPNGSPNVQLFNEWLREWDVHGQTTSGATEALLGKAPTAGTPFRLEALVTQQGMGLHEYRRGKFATFIAEIYRDWIIPDIAKKITKGTKFLSSLTPDEMEYVTDCIVRYKANEFIKERILNGELVDEEELEAIKSRTREDFVRGGNKKFIEILKDEFKDINLSVKVNVAGKQKDLVSIVDKMVNLFRQVLANPAVLQDPKAVKIFNKLIEYSGLDPIDFGYVSSNKPQEMAQPQPQIQAPGLPSPSAPALV